MKTTTQSSTATRAAMTLLAAIGLGAGTAALAHGGDVFWSIGMHQPGVSIGVSNYPARPVLVHTPVYLPPPPVVVHHPRVIYAPQPVVYGGYPGYYGHHHHRHGHGHAYGHRKQRERWDGKYERGGHEHRGGDHGRYEGGHRDGYGGGRGPEINIGRR